MMACPEENKTEYLPIVQVLRDLSGGDIGLKDLSK